MTRPIEEVFHDHLAKRAAGDVEGDITENYSPDVILLTGTGSFKGHDGVRASAKELASYVGEIPFEYNHTMIEGRYAFWNGPRTAKTAAYMTAPTALWLRTAR